MSAASQAEHHRQAAAGRVLDLELAAHRLDEPLRDGEPEADAVAVRRRRRAAGRAGTPARARPRGMPGPRSMTRRSTPSPARAGDDADRLARRACADRVVDEVGERALEQARVGDDARAASRRRRRRRRRGRAPRLASAAGHDLVDPDCGRG